MAYMQKPLETNGAFADRIRFWMAKDLDSKWEKWNPRSRQNLACKFLQGLTDADYTCQQIYKNVDELAAMSWKALKAHLITATAAARPA